MTKTAELLPMHRERADALAVRDPEELLRFAVEKGADVGTIERLMTVRRELNAEKAKAAYDAAMAAFQAECPVILKTKAVKTGSETLYAYSPFEQIVAQIKELLQKHGFSFRLDTDVESKDGWVIAMCRVVHSAGHTETSTAKFPLGTGTRAMSTTQVFAAALTFASRRVFCNAFGIIPAAEDFDGATGRPKPPGPSTKTPRDASVKELARELWAALGDVCKGDKDWQRANQWLVDECILTPDEQAPDLSPERFRQVVATVKTKRQ